MNVDSPEAVVPTVNWLLEIARSFVAPVVVTLFTLAVMSAIGKYKAKSVRQTHPLSFASTGGGYFLLRNVSKKLMLDVWPYVIDGEGNSVMSTPGGFALESGAEYMIGQVPTGSTLRFSWREYKPRKQPQDQQQFQTSLVRVEADKLKYSLEREPISGYGG